MTSSVAHLNTVPQLREWVLRRRTADETIGLVPTMGALHEGHLSLVRAAQQMCQRTIVTIFVNPAQFGPQEDFQRYPRSADQDAQVLAAMNVDAVFRPALELMYPEGFSTFIDPPRVARRWEGEFRPGHFRGVATVVLKLFQLIPAEVAFFGEKDFQQCRVIEQMCSDLEVPIALRRCPTVREPDGLAMSSRNRYLDARQRQAALSLSRGLAVAQQLVAQGLRDTATIVQRMQADMAEAGIQQVDYVAIVDPDSLEPLDQLDDQTARVLIAAHVGSTRLIDNAALNEEEPGDAADPVLHP